jgi:TonB family protein
MRISMMVDPRGRPFEVRVEQSSGNKVLDGFMVVAWQRVAFKPATVNGKPVESVYEITHGPVGTYTPRHGLAQEHLGPYASLGDRPEPTFIHAYEALQTAVGAKDRAAADVALKSLIVRTPYEDCIYGLAKFQYKTVWGADLHEQADALSHALDFDTVLTTIAAAPDPAIAPLRRLALLDGIHVQLQLHDYFQVLQLWDRLQKLGVDQETAARITPTIERIKQLRAGPGEYAMSDSIGQKGSWSIHLFKKTFALGVSSGGVSQLKLKCKGKYVQFQFDQTLKYTVPEEAGECLLDVEGTPGTKFELTQS